MSAPDTRPPAITEDQLQRLERALAGMARGGANVNVTDPRVSAVQNWILGLIGMGVVSAGIWGAQSLYDLKTLVGAAIARQEQQQRVQDDHEQRIRQLERRP